MEKKIQVQIIEKTHEVVTETTELISNPAVDAERKKLVDIFLRFEEIDINGEPKKPTQLVEENLYYLAFRKKGAPDPFVEFDDYIRKSIGMGVYKGMELRKINPNEIVPLLGRYKQMVDVLKDETLFDREKLETIDIWLTEFLRERINHFFDTLDHRIHAVAALRAGDNKKALTQIEVQFSDKLPTEFLERKRQEVGMIIDENDTIEFNEDGIPEMSVREFKAHRLAKISREITDAVDEVFKNPEYADPLVPDNYHQ